jgi:hypothetical protein
MIVALFLAAATPQAASVPVELSLDAEGKVVGCTMDDPLLDDAQKLRICMAMFRNQRFEPGRDAAGNPAPSTYVTSFTRRARAATPAELASAEARASAPAVPPSAPASAR